MMELKNSFRARFFCFFMSFFLYVLPFVLALSISPMRFYLFFCSFFYAPPVYLFIFYLFRVFSLFTYISMLFLLFYISDSLSYFYFYLLFMPLIVLSSIWEKGHLGFVCCFSAFSTISAFFFCFLFLFYPSSVSAFSSFFLSLFS